MKQEFWVRDLVNKIFKNVLGIVSDKERLTLRHQIWAGHYPLSYKDIPTRDQWLIMPLVKKIQMLLEYRSFHNILIYEDPYWYSRLYYRFETMFFLIPQTVYFFFKWTVGYPIDYVFLRPFFFNDCSVNLSHHTYWNQVRCLYYPQVATDYCLYFMNGFNEYWYLAPAGNFDLYRTFIPIDGSLMTELINLHPYPVVWETYIQYDVAPLQIAVMLDKVLSQFGDWLHYHYRVGNWFAYANQTIDVDYIRKWVFDDFSPTIQYANAFDDVYGKIQIGFDDWGKGRFDEIDKFLYDGRWDSFNAAKTDKNYLLNYEGVFDFDVLNYDSSGWESTRLTEHVYLYDRAQLMDSTLKEVYQIPGAKESELGDYFTFWLKDFYYASSTTQGEVTVSFANNALPTAQKVQVLLHDLMTYDSVFLYRTGDLFYDFSYDFNFLPKIVSFIILGYIFTILFLIVWYFLELIYKWLKKEKLSVKIFYIYRYLYGFSVFFAVLVLGYWLSFGLYWGYLDFWVDAYTTKYSPYLGERFMVQDSGSLLITQDIRSNLVAVAKHVVETNLVERNFSLLGGLFVMVWLPLHVELLWVLDETLDDDKAFFFVSLRFLFALYYFLFCFSVGFLRLAGLVFDFQAVGAGSARGFFDSKRRAWYSHKTDMTFYAHDLEDRSTALDGRQQYKNHRRSRYEADPDSSLGENLFHLTLFMEYFEMIISNRLSIPEAIEKVFNLYSWNILRYLRTLFQEACLFFIYYNKNVNYSDYYLNLQKRLVNKVGDVNFVSGRVGTSFPINQRFNMPFVENPGQYPNFFGRYLKFARPKYKKVRHAPFRSYDGMIYFPTTRKNTLLDYYFMFNQCKDIIGVPYGPNSSLWFIDNFEFFMFSKPELQQGAFFEQEYVPQTDWSGRNDLARFSIKLDHQEYANSLMHNFAKHVYRFNSKQLGGPASVKSLIELNYLQFYVNDIVNRYMLVYNHFYNKTVFGHKVVPKLSKLFDIDRDLKSPFFKARHFNKITPFPFLGAYDFLDVLTYHTIPSRRKERKTLMSLYDKGSVNTYRDVARMEVKELLYLTQVFKGQGKYLHPYRRVFKNRFKHKQTRPDGLSAVRSAMSNVLREENDVGDHYYTWEPVVSSSGFQGSQYVDNRAEVLLEDHKIYYPVGNNKIIQELFVKKTRRRETRFNVLYANLKRKGQLPSLPKKFVNETAQVFNFKFTMQRLIALKRASLAEKIMHVEKVKTARSHPKYYFRMYKQWYHLAQDFELFWYDTLPHYKTVKVPEVVQDYNSFLTKSVLTDYKAIYINKLKLKQLKQPRQRNKWYYTPESVEAPKKKSALSESLFSYHEKIQVEPVKLERDSLSVSVMGSHKNLQNISLPKRIELGVEYYVQKLRRMAHRLVSYYFVKVDLPELVSPDILKEKEVAMKRMQKVRANFENSVMSANMSLKPEVVNANAQHVQKLKVLNWMPRHKIQNVRGAIESPVSQMIWPASAVRLEQTNVYGLGLKGKQPRLKLKRRIVNEGWLEVYENVQVLDKLLTNITDNDYRKFVRKQLDKQLKVGIKFFKKTIPDAIRDISPQKVDEYFQLDLMASRVFLGTANFLTFPDFYRTGRDYDFSYEEDVMFSKLYLSMGRKTQKRYKRFLKTYHPDLDMQELIKMRSEIRNSDDRYENIVESKSYFSNSIRSRSEFYPYERSAQDEYTLLYIKDYEDKYDLYSEAMLENYKAIAKSLPERGITTIDPDLWYFYQRTRM